MSSGIFGYDASKQDVTAMTISKRLTPREVIAEINKFPDRQAIAVYFGAANTIIVSEMLPIINVEDGSREQVQN